MVPSHQLPCPLLGSKEVLPEGAGESKVRTKLRDFLWLLILHCLPPPDPPSSPCCPPTPGAST